MSEKPKRRKRGNPNFYKGMPAANPKGRTKGSVNKYTALAREVMSAKGPEIVQKVIDKAMEGDVHCLKMCMDRILPVQKAVDSNRAKQDSQIVINVASIDSIEQKVLGTPQEKLVNPKEKVDDEVIVNISNE